ncbi:hypothetical protein J2X98_004507 [Pseudarthrobacter enclensis]|uniref:Uncharacterized protein n=1 Tax=Pseudarthrobacter enclensis TaxID=993070 RepID=A0ABT9S1V5_9MICC|nr:hypothetical protein [Pseudarthrobacter enclensis]
MGTVCLDTKLSVEQRHNHSIDGRAGRGAPHLSLTPLNATDEDLPGLETEILMVELPPRNAGLPYSQCHG